MSTKSFVIGVCLGVEFDKEPEKPQLRPVLEGIRRMLAGIDKQLRALITDSKD